MDTIKKMWPFLFVAIIIYYGCPMVAESLGKSLKLVVLLTPFLCCTIGFIYCWEQEISKALPVVCTLLAMPAILLFYTFTAWSYPFLFGLSVLVGEIGGHCIGQVYVE